jgi:hypothetical protein
MRRYGNKGHRLNFFVKMYIKGRDTIKNVLTCNSRKNSVYEDESPSALQEIPQFSWNPLFHYQARNSHRNSPEPVEASRRFQKTIFIHLCIYMYLSRQSYSSVTFWLLFRNIHLSSLFSNILYPSSSFIE